VTTQAGFLEDSPWIVCPLCGARPAPRSEVDRLGNVAAADTADDLPASQTAARPPGYEILEPLYHDGLATVYKVRQTSVGRVVTVRVVNGLAADRHVRRLFRRETAALCCLNHPNVVTLLDAGESGGRYSLVLEYVGGGSVADKLRGGWSPSGRQAAELLEVVARAVHAVHEKRLVHRNLKPANVLMTPDGRPKLSDFGLCLGTEADQSEGVEDEGTIVGTPAYLAPEQATPRQGLGPATDVWALGVILYECLTGRPPFKGPTALDTIENVVRAEAVPPRRVKPELARDLEAITLKCLRKDPGQRYPSALALADDLRRFLNGEVVHARPVNLAVRLAKWVRRRPVIAALLAVLILVTLAGQVALAWEYRLAEERARQAKAALEQLRQP
jgi:serine/threonine-protein kinase